MIKFSHILLSKPIRPPKGDPIPGEPADVVLPTSVFTSSKSTPTGQKTPGYEIIYDPASSLLRISKGKAHRVCHISMMVDGRLEEESEVSIFGNSGESNEDLSDESPTALAQRIIPKRNK